ncbi:MAG: ABC transporter ATP-binding protein [Bacillaceae bacterium]
MIHIQNVTKCYGKQEVLSNVSIDVNKGEIFGLLGPSGAGKTTLIRLIIGMEAPNEGTIAVMNETVPNVSVIEQIGYTAQADALYIDLSAEENMKFYCELYGIPKKQWEERINDSLGVVNLTAFRKKIVSTYSGGMKRRLSLAISLLHRPKLLVLDEPTVGMDPILRQQVWNELYRLKENGVTILMTTHVMDEAEKCDRIAMIRDGHCIAVGGPEQLVADFDCRNIEEVFLKLGGVMNAN